MKELYRFFSRVFLCLSVIVTMTAYPDQVQAQYYSKTPVVNATPAQGAYTGSYYEFLPPGYDPNGSTLYPIMIFNHGAGESGDGSSGQLPRVLVNGPPKLINNGTFPTSFTVGGQTFSFIVLAPQCFYQPDGNDISPFIDYALSHYKADPNRLYLTGLSQGGAPTWYYPALSPEKCQKVAAILSVCGNGEMDPQDAVMVAQNHLPALATHNAADPTVPEEYTTTNVNNMNNAGANPQAIAIIFDDPDYPGHRGTHDAWTLTYDPNFKPSDIGGLNVYQWMLQYSRGSSGPLPVKLTSYTAMLTADGTQVDIDWTTAIEQNNKQFIIQRSTDGKDFIALDSIASAATSGGGHSYTYTDRAPLRGNNFYRLIQIDLDGKTTYFDVLKVMVGGSSATSLRVSPNPSSGMLYLDLVSPEQGSLQVVLTDVQGKTLQTWNFNKPGMSWSQSINLGNLPSGSYFIRVQGKTIREVRQFLRK